MLKARIGSISYNLERRRHLDVDLGGRIGMGALLCYAIRMLAYANQAGKEARLICTSPLYSNGSDVFSKFFDQGIGDEPFHPHSKLANEWLVHHLIPWTIPLSFARDLFHRHFDPSPFLKSHLGEKYDLSVHFRATDKIMETGEPPRDIMLSTLMDEIAGRKLRIFVATDDQRFRDQIHSKFDFCEFSSFELGDVEEGVARHFSELPAEDKSKEAIINIFKLASAPVCIRTMSYFSALVPIINRDCRTITVNCKIRPNYFPEDEIWDLEHASELG